MDVITLLNLLNAEGLLRNKSMKDNWPRLSSSIREYLGDDPDSQRFISLGGQLSLLFGRDDPTNSDTGVKGQRDVSVSGNVWSRLVNWYLNICLLGTSCWASSTGALVPRDVREAIRITVGGHEIPGSREVYVLCYHGDRVPEVALPNDIRGVDLSSSYRGTIDSFLRSVNLGDIKLVLLAAKTPGSDMLAIPLFWNFLYKGNLMPRHIFDLQVGTNEKRPGDLIGGRVYYSVVVVPSGKESRIKNGRIPGRSTLRKLGLLDGGFYWGRPSTRRVPSFDNFLRENLGQAATGAGSFMSEYFEHIDRERSVFYNAFHARPE